MRQKLIYLSYANHVRWRDQRISIAAEPARCASSRTSFLLPGLRPSLVPGSSFCPAASPGSDELIAAVLTSESLTGVGHTTAKSASSPGYPRPRAWGPHAHADFRPKPWRAHEIFANSPSPSPRKNAPPSYFTKSFHFSTIRSFTAGVWQGSDSLVGAQQAAPRVRQKSLHWIKNLFLSLA